MTTLDGLRILQHLLQIRRCMCILPYITTNIILRSRHRRTLQDVSGLRILSRLLDLTRTRHEVHLTRHCRADMMIRRVQVTLRIIPIRAISEIKQTRQIIRTLLITRRLLTDRGRQRTLQDRRDNLYRRIRACRFIINCMQRYDTRAINRARIIIAARMDRRLQQFIHPHLSQMIRLHRVCLQVHGNACSTRLSTFLLVELTGRRTTLVII